MASNLVVRPKTARCRVELHSGGPIYSWLPCLGEHLVGTRTSSEATASGGCPLAGHREQQDPYYGECAGRDRHDEALSGRRDDPLLRDRGGHDELGPESLSQRPAGSGISRIVFRTAEPGARAEGGFGDRETGLGSTCGCVRSSVVAGPWLFWLAVAVAMVFLVLFALARLRGDGRRSLGAIVLSARAALAPSAREDTDEALRRACHRLPFCDCAPSSPRWVERFRLEASVADRRVTRLCRSVGRDVDADTGCPCWPTAMPACSCAASSVPLASRTRVTDE